MLYTAEKQVCPQKDAALYFPTKYWLVMIGKFDFPNFPSASDTYTRQEISPTLEESSQLRKYLAHVTVNAKLKLTCRIVSDERIKALIPHHESSESTLSLSSLIREWKMLK